MMHMGHGGVFGSANAHKFVETCEMFGAFWSVASFFGDGMEGAERRFTSHCIADESESVRFGNMRRRTRSAACDVELRMSRRRSLSPGLLSRMASLRMAMMPGRSEERMRPWIMWSSPHMLRNVSLIAGPQNGKIS